jgi:hypothetical protein
MVAVVVAVAPAAAATAVVVAAIAPAVAATAVAAAVAAATKPTNPINGSNAVAKFLNQPGAGLRHLRLQDFGFGAFFVDQSDSAHGQCVCGPA